MDEVAAEMRNGKNGKNGKTEACVLAKSLGSCFQSLLCRRKLAWDAQFFRKFEATQPERLFASPPEALSPNKLRRSNLSRNPKHLCGVN